MTHPLDAADGRDVVARWCALAERRLEYLTDMFETGRWRRYHSESAFLENIREAKAAAETWRDISRREATVDNLAIDMSWLGRRTGATSAPQPAEIPAPLPLQDGPIHSNAGPVAEEAPSVPGFNKVAAVLAQDIAATADRYPLLRNQF